MQPIFVMIKTIFSYFDTQDLILSEVVLYASNHGVLRLK